MEKARSYWTTLGRRRFSEMPFLGAQIPSLAAARSSSFDESWEEEAFAKDSAGHLGGCVWPPRSYSCSFCRREFRSAQALGGHMNVHRKDRAMLKQCPRAAGDQTLDVAHLGSPAREVQYGGSATANPNPNSASSLSPRVSAAVPAQEWSLQSSTPCLYSSSIVRIVREKLKEYSIVSAAAPTTLQLFAAPESSLNKTNKRLQQIGGDDLGTREAKFRTVLGDEDKDDENNECNKRRRIESTERRSVQDAQKEALGEELDLELRLGDISQVK